MQSARYYQDDVTPHKREPVAKPQSRRTKTGLRVTELLAELRIRCATGVGPRAAKDWRMSIGGICYDEDERRVICIEIDGIKHIGHWLIDYLNQRLGN